MRGRFITLEGIDGAGKSTQIDVIADRLRAHGADLVVTREPGGTALGESLRNLVLHQPMTARAETLLVFAARAEHVATVVEPALNAGRWVLCDRFTDATFAYQGGGRGVPEGDLEALEAWVHPHLQPDLTLLFDVPPDVAAARLASARAADRFEREQTVFFSRVRAAYAARARSYPGRFAVIDGTLDAAGVRQCVLDRLEQWLKRD
jgi:dTMP kinase